MKAEPLKSYTFKQLVTIIADADVKTWGDFNLIGGAIAYSFDHEKITYKDYELLFKLLGHQDPERRTA